MDPTVVLIQGGGFMKQGSIFIPKDPTDIHRIKYGFICLSHQDTLCPPLQSAYSYICTWAFICVYICIHIRILQLYILYVYTYIGTERDRGNSGSFQ